MDSEARRVGKRTHFKALTPVGEHARLKDNVSTFPLIYKGNGGELNIKPYQYIGKNPCLISREIRRKLADKTAAKWPRGL